MRADDHVHTPLTKARQHRLLLLWRPKAREHLHAKRERLKALLECAPVLLRQDGGWHQEGYLLAVHDGLERTAQRHLGLSVPHIACNQTVHWTGPFHVSLDVIDRAELIRRFFKSERGLKLPLPRRVR